MKEIFNPKFSLVFFIVASIVIFFTVLNFNQIYRSEISILVIPKSEKAVQNSDQIIENIRNIPQTLFFFNRIISIDEKFLSDQIEDLPDNKKKKYWNSKIGTERISEAGIFKIIISDRIRYRSEFLCLKTSEELIKTIGIYYDIKKDVDVRIIDGLVTEYVSGVSKIFLFFVSIVFSLLLSFLINFILVFLFKKKNITIPKINLFENRSENFKKDFNKVIVQEEAPWEIPQKKEVISSFSKKEWRRIIYLWLRIFFP
jgi:hypothetical protein